jgi:hypothetical protein
MSSLSDALNVVASRISEILEEFSTELSPFDDIIVVECYKKLESMLEEKIEEMYENHFGLNPLTRRNKNVYLY